MSADELEAKVDRAIAARQRADRAREKAVQAEAEAFRELHEARGGARGVLSNLARRSGWSDEYVRQAVKPPAGG